jgi:hypothetical protein
MLRRVIASMGISITIVGWAASAKAAGTVPNVLTEQGRLLDATNNPITTAVTMTFAIYNDKALGTPATALWTEKQTITPDNGFFSAELGSVTALPPSIFTGQNLWLGLTVNTDAEMTPRQPMVSVPYALTAQNVIGNITPASVAIGATAVIDATGHWVGPNTGLIGPTGPQGNPGTNGTNGTNGATGPMGPPGNPGTNGTNGAPGATGPQGIPGTNGTNGTNGAPGPGGYVGYAYGTASTAASYNIVTGAPPGSTIPTTVTPNHAVSCMVSAHSFVWTTATTAGYGIYPAIQPAGGSASSIGGEFGYWTPEGGSSNTYLVASQSGVVALAAGTTYSFGCFQSGATATFNWTCTVSWACL